MAYVNIAEWNSDQVAEWLKGLDDVLHPYIHFFIKNNVDGSRLLHLAYDELPHLNVTSIGHQEIILQGVELLSNIHYHIHQENVQLLSLRVSSKARSVYNEICTLESAMEAVEDQEPLIGAQMTNGGAHMTKRKERVPTRIIASVADVLSSVKTLISWFHRAPFHGTEQYDDMKSNLVNTSIGLATVAQRDSFAENPVSVIRESCLKLAEIADTVIQDSKDPLVLQPASLDVVTLKKRADDNWGLGLLSSYHGVHQVSGIRPLSPAHNCGKVSGGDQLVQVNYQTVLGWMSYKVMQLMQENPTQVILTLKKCPRHVNTITEIYFKPIRLPSKKRNYSPWSTGNVLTTQTYDLQSISNLPIIKSADGRIATPESVDQNPNSLTSSSLASSNVTVTLNSTGSDLDRVPVSDSEREESELEDEAFMSDDEDEGASSLRNRLFHPKPRPNVQRRATIPGATPRPSLSYDQGYCRRHLCELGFPDNRRPHTCIGNEKSKKTRFPSVKDEIDMPYIDESDEKEEPSDGKKVLPSDSEVAVSIKSPVVLLNYSEELRRPMTPPKSPIEALDELKRFRRTSEDRPKLDKSYSSPTYDLDDSELGDFVGRKNFFKLMTPGKRSSAVESTSSTLAETGNESDKTTPRAKSTTLEIPDSEVEIIKTEIGNPDCLFSLDISHSSLSRQDAPNVTDFQGASSILSLSTKSGGRCFPTPNQTVTNVSLSSLSSKCTDSNENPPIRKFLSECVQTVPIPHPSYATHDYINYNSSRGGDLSACGNHCFGDGLKKNLAVPADNHDSPEKVDPLDSEVVLREGPRSKSPSSWRRGVVGHDSGHRRISCRELGLGDHHGWLHRRRDSKGFLMSHRWEKRWFILKKSYLYGYRDKDSLKADSLIYLPGFHVCPASDVKSKRFAFKIYHSSGAAFYFSCDTAEERSRWMSQMGLSAISCSDSSQDEDGLKNEEPYYSETDDELEKSASVRSPTSRDPSPPKDPNLGAFSSVALGRSTGLKFLQSSKSSLSHPLPTSNFRSYIRVRETSSERSPFASPPDSAKREKVRRKGSLRERLKQFPAAFSLDRRKSTNSVGGGRSESSLTLRPSLLKEKSIKSSSHLPNASAASIQVKEAAELELFPRSSSSRGAAKRLSSLRRGSLDCLNSNDEVTLRTTSGLGSIGNLNKVKNAIESIPDRHWINLLKSNTAKSRSGICVKVLPLLEMVVQEKPGRGQKTSGMSLNISPSKSVIRKSSIQLPVVPPRTKFLSPTKRSFAESSPHSPEGMRRGRAKAPPNLVLPSSPEEAELSRTPLKPAMGVPMIGKQRRTPGAVSPPCEVFVFSASPSPPSSLTLTPLSRSNSSGHIWTNHRSELALPHYPGMEYPPTFEPESYSLNLTHSDSPYPPIPPKPQLSLDSKCKKKDFKPVIVISKGQKSPATSAIANSGLIVPNTTAVATTGYVNISHVSDSMAEFRGNRYHHSIYVTSPTGGGSRVPVSSYPNAPLNEYVQMGQVYINTSSFSRSEGADTYGRK